MFVPPDQQRRGVGNRRLEQCLDSTRKLGISKFVLHSTADGRRLYCGFDQEAKTAFLARPPAGEA